MQIREEPNISHVVGTDKLFLKTMETYRFELRNHSSKSLTVRDTDKSYQNSSHFKFIQFRLAKGHVLVACASVIAIILFLDFENMGIDTK